MSAPTTMQSAAASRRSVSTLTACAMRTPTDDARAARTAVIQAADAKSIWPYGRLPDRAGGGGDDLQHLARRRPRRAARSRASTIIGTEKSGPPAPDSPEPNPDTAPTPTQHARCSPRPLAVAEALCARRAGSRMYDAGEHR